MFKVGDIVIVNVKRYISKTYNISGAERLKQFGPYKVLYVAKYLNTFNVCEIKSSVNKKIFSISDYFLDLVNDSPNFINLGFYV